MNSNLTIKHIDGDMSYNMDGNSFDTYEVSDGTNSVKVEFTYNDGKDAVSASNEDACMLRHINSSIYLIACVNYTIMKGITEDHFFYCEQFYDEDGHSVSKELTIIEF